MKINNFEGKNYDETLEKALKELNCSKEEVLIKVEEKKGKLFKSVSFILTIIKLSDIEEKILEYLDQLLHNMDLKISFESALKNGTIYIKMHSNNNGILIGKNGQTIESLQTISKNVINKEIGIFPNLILDVEDYKEKQEKNLERLAKNVAREVIRTKVPAALDSMNSYERRIIHSTLTDFKGVTTESEGEEPNRRVIIKPILK